MEERKGELLEWLFIVALIIPVVVLGKMRLHQRNLALFLILAIICVAVVMTVYYCYRKRLTGKEH